MMTMIHALFLIQFFGLCQAMNTELVIVEITPDQLLGEEVVSGISDGTLHISTENEDIPKMSVVYMIQGSDGSLRQQPLSFIDLTCYPHHFEYGKFLTTMHEVSQRSLKQDCSDSTSFPSKLRLLCGRWAESIDNLTADFVKIDENGKEYLRCINIISAGDIDALLNDQKSIFVPYFVEPDNLVIGLGLMKEFDDLDRTKVVPVARILLLKIYQIDKLSEHVGIDLGSEEYASKYVHVDKAGERFIVAVIVTEANNFFITEETVENLIA